MNQQQALEIITKALQREQQARDQLETALAEALAEVVRLEAQVKEPKPTMT